MSCEGAVKAHGQAALAQDGVFSSYLVDAISRNQSPSCRRRQVALFLLLIFAVSEALPTLPSGLDGRLHELHNAEIKPLADKGTTEKDVAKKGYMGNCNDYLGCRNHGNDYCMQKANFNCACFNNPNHPKFNACRAACNACAA